jgi:uncharacterized protein
MNIKNIKQHRDYLTVFLNSPDRPEGTIQYHELQGFLFAIACSPVLLQPSDWLPVIFNDQEGNYADMDEATKVLQSFLDIYNLINTGVITGNIDLPEDIVIDETPLENIGETALLGQWSRGFTIVNNWLIDVWHQYIPDELEDELLSAMMVLSSFASQELADSYCEESPTSSEQSIEEFTQDMLDMFNEAMRSYAHIGRSIYTALIEQEQEQEPFVNENKIGRNDPCPCGSGKKYKMCCGVN